MAWEGEFICASDTPALAGLTRTILPMEDGEVALLSPLGIELYNEAGERQQRTPTVLSNQEGVADKRISATSCSRKSTSSPKLQRFGGTSSARGADGRESSGVAV